MVGRNELTLSITESVILERIYKMDVVVFENKFTRIYVGYSCVVLLLWYNNHISTRYYLDKLY